MKPQESKVFWDIINCGLNEFGTSSLCSGVTNSQGSTKKEDFHIPEPWNGNLSTARILFVSINPGYSKGELYPRTGNVFWAPNGAFNHAKVEEFFEGRFNLVNPYVSYKPGGHAFKIAMESGSYKSVRGFWNYIFKMARIILPQADPCKDIAITELVHCKSKDISFLTTPCLDRCMKTHIAKVFKLAMKVDWVIFIGAPVRECIRRYYGFSSPVKQEWYCTSKLNGRNTKIVFVDHNNAFPDKNGKRFTGILPPPAICLAI